MIDVEEMKPLDQALLQEFVGDAAEALEEALWGLDNGAPLFVYSGDLRVEGDISSDDLLAGCGGFEPPVGDTASERAFTIFIRGTLDVAGTLRVEQYHDVYVQRDVRAGSILSHTGNLVTRGTVSAAEIITFECNEEGGFLHGASCDVPLLCRFGVGGWEWAVSNMPGKMEIWEILDDPQFAALRASLAQLGVEASWYGVRDLILSGRSAALLQALARW